MSVGPESARWERQLVAGRDRVAQLVADARQRRLEAERAQTRAEGLRKRAQARRLLGLAARELDRLERLLTAAPGGRSSTIPAGRKVGRGRGRVGKVGNVGSRRANG